MGTLRPVKVSISDGVYVECEVKQEERRWLLDCQLRRMGRLGLKIHEEIDSLDDVVEVMERPRWLGEESQEALIRALRRLMEELNDENQ